MSQLNLFAQPAVGRHRARDPVTSQASAQAATFVGRHEALILAALKLGPATAHEIAARVGEGWTNVTVSRRLAAMAKRGLVQRTGEPGVTPSGRSAEVWRRHAE